MSLRVLDGAEIPTAELVDELRRFPSLRTADRAASRLEQLERSNKELREALEKAAQIIPKLVQHTPSSTIPCNGYKCREQWCFSCNGEEDAETYIQTVFNDVHEAGEFLAALSAADKGEKG